MSVDIHEVAATIEDMDAQPVGRDPRPVDGPDPVTRERQFRQMRERALRCEERLRP